MLNDAVLRHASLHDLDRMLSKAKLAYRMHSTAEAASLFGMVFCWIVGMLTTPAVAIFLIFKISPHTTALDVAEGIGIVAMTIVTLSAAISKIHRFFRRSHDISASMGCWKNVEVNQIEVAISLRADERRARTEAAAIHAGSKPASPRPPRSKQRI